MATKRERRITSTPPLLWNSSDLCAATGGTAAVDFAITGFSLDSRTIAPGEMFVAIKDERDGHHYAAAALVRGAAAAMVDHDPPGVRKGAPLLKVDDTLLALSRLGATARSRSTAKFIGVTGSVGKTTTKELLGLILAQEGSTHIPMGSYNNHLGVPLTLARMPRDTQYAVIEMGMNHRGEMAPLSLMSRPHVAIITNIYSAHIGHLGSLNAIAEEKGHIYDGLEPGGTAVLPRDSEFFEVLAAHAIDSKANIVSFGEHPNADVRILEFRGHSNGSDVDVMIDGNIHTMQLKAPGMHIALNACACIAAVGAIGVPVERAILALSGFGARPGRGERSEIQANGGTAILLDDSYNASSASIRAGLAVLSAQKAKRRVVVLGDMRELGNFGVAIHKELAPSVVSHSDLAFCCGPLMKHLYDDLPPEKRGAYARDADSLIPMLQSAVSAGDAVFVKGSLGSKMAAIVKALKAERQAPSSREIKAAELLRSS
jgi:UDP-N-acetylmuramoyl-tripeptide--D-alanyl-D-alanine ligase